MAGWQLFHDASFSLLSSSNQVKGAFDSLPACSKIATADQTRGSEEVTR